MDTRLQAEKPAKSVMPVLLSRLKKTRLGCDASMSFQAGLPFRFKKEDDNPRPAAKLVQRPPAPSKLAIAINGPDDLNELKRIDAAIAASGVLIGPNSLSPEAVAVFNEFELAMPNESAKQRRNAMTQCKVRANKRSRLTT